MGLPVFTAAMLSLAVWIAGCTHPGYKPPAGVTSGNGATVSGYAFPGRELTNGRTKVRIAAVDGTSTFYGPYDGYRADVLVSVGDHVIRACVDQDSDRFVPKLRKAGCADISVRVEAGGEYILRSTRHEEMERPPEDEIWMEEKASGRTITARVRAPMRVTRLRE